MGELGSNQVTEEEFVTHEFDPFKDTTSTRLNQKSGFRGGAVGYLMSLERLQSGGEEVFDAPRMLMTGITDQTGHSATLDMWDLTRVNEVVFNADHENITCKEMWSNTPDIIENSSELDWYQGYCENLILFESQEQLKKIASASSLEIRVSTYAGYVDLDDDEEAVFQNSLKLFYNQVYDKSAFADELDEAKDASKRFAEAENDSSGCFIATAVYGTDSHPNLIVLRSFRDNFLSEYSLGQRFIKFYYKYGPNFALKVSSNKGLKLLFSGLVNLGVSIVKTFKIG